MVSLSCDYRIMADNPGYKIGLNETQLGIVAPFWCVSERDGSIRTLFVFATHKSIYFPNNIFYREVSELVCFIAKNDNQFRNLICRFQLA